MNNKIVVLHSFSNSIKQKISLKKLFFNIREAILGTDQDFTSGSLSRAIFLLSIPMVLEMVMESIFAVVDIYFVSALSKDVAVARVVESPIVFDTIVLDRLSLSVLSSKRVVKLVDS